MADGPLRIYATPERVPLLRHLLPAACQVTGGAVQLEQLETGSLFRRLHREHGDARADLIVSNGPYMAEAAVRDGFLEAHPPAHPATDSGNLVWHRPDWGWAALDMRPFVVVGTPPVADVADLADQGTVTRLAVPDPARSEAGLTLQLLLLDASRQAGKGDPWAMWTARAAQQRLLLRDRPDTTLAALAAGLASHAVVPADTAALPASAAPLAGLPPLPNAVGLVAGAPHAPLARGLLDWLLGPDAAPLVTAAGAVSPWQPSVTGSFDLDWTFAQYRSVRQSWLARGLSL